MAKDGLINCKKCGTLFFKTSGREICEECFNKELEVIDGIKNYVKSFKGAQISIDELSKETNISREDIEDLLSRGRLFSILTRISVKCRFWGVELEDDEKTGFTCKNCLMKFSPKVNELEKKGLSVKKYEEEARNLKRRLRGGMNTVDNSNRFGFIQNYDL